MKTLVRQLWNEPAAFLGAVQIAGQVAQVLLIHDRTANALLAVLFGSAGAGATRQLSKPAAPRR